MKSLIFKVSTVLVTVVSVTLMAAALSVYFAHPDATSEMNTLAMLNYDFQQSTGENPMWTVKRRFSVVAADSKERGTVGSYKTVYEAITKSHEDLATQMVSQKTEKGSLKTSVAEQLVKFDASQQQDVQAIGDRVAILQAEAEQWQTQVQDRSDEAQAISVNTLEVREETAARRTDVLRLRHELEEARTDLFRLNEILRHDTDQLLRVELENQALDQRLQQLQQ
ncbi:MAG: hypothetical protein NTX48_11885 [Planctomycetales bacterium]|jgi:chromosome segregation ATPase|nr:hypothetical protein [Planctomycetales bacterium]